MKPFFKRMGLFALALLGVCFLLFIASSQSYIIESKLVAQETNWGYVNQRSTEWNKNELHEEDVLFFGSSTCYSGIDPSALNAFGLSGFNFCSSSQAIGNSASLIPAASMDVSPAMHCAGRLSLGFGAQQRLLWKARKTGSSTAICGRRLGQRRIERWRLNPATFSPLLQPSITISYADSKRPEAIPISQKI